MKLRIIDILASIAVAALLLALARASETRRDPIVFAAPLVTTTVLAGLLAAVLVVRYGPARLRPAFGGGLVFAAAYLTLTALPRFSSTIGANFATTRPIAWASQALTCLVDGVPLNRVPFYG